MLAPEDEAYLNSLIASVRLGRRAVLDRRRCRRTSALHVQQRDARGGGDDAGQGRRGDGPPSRRRRRLDRHLRHQLIPSIFPSGATCELVVVLRARITALKTRTPYRPLTRSCSKSARWFATCRATAKFSRATRSSVRYELKAACKLRAVELPDASRASHSFARVTTALSRTRGRRRHENVENVRADGFRERDAAVQRIRVRKHDHADVLARQQRVHRAIARNLAVRPNETPCRRAGRSPSPCRSSCAGASGGREHRSHGVDAQQHRHLDVPFRQIVDRRNHAGVASEPRRIPRCARPRTSRPARV